MKLDAALHRREPWRAHALAADFRLEDYWGLPIRVEHSGQGTFREFIGIATRFDPSASSGTVRALVALREWLGMRFGWDEGNHTLPIPGCRETSLSERLTEADRVASHPEWADPPRQQLVDVRTVYVFENEAMFEVSNRTIHALLHFGWCEAADGSHSPRLAVYVKPRGWFSHAYMSAIAPFRYAFVYPAWIAAITRAWERRPRAAV